MSLRVGDDFGDASMPIKVFWLGCLCYCLGCCFWAFGRCSWFCDVWGGLSKCRWKVSLGTFFRVSDLLEDLSGGVFADVLGHVFGGDVFGRLVGAMFC